MNMATKSYEFQFYYSTYITNNVTAEIEGKTVVKAYQMTFKESGNC
jgi:hypothetical protein